MVWDSVPLGWPWFSHFAKKMRMWLNHCHFLANLFFFFWLYPKITCGKTKSHRPGETGQMSPRLQHIHLCLSVLTDGPDLARYVFKFVFKFGVSKGNICRSAVVSQPELWRWRDGIVKKDCFDADAVSEVFLSTYGTHTQVKSQRNSPLSERLEEHQNVLWSDSITISVCGSRPGLWKCLCWGFFITGVFFSMP